MNHYVFGFHLLDMLSSAFIGLSKAYANHPNIRATEILYQQNRLMW